MKQKLIGSLLLGALLATTPTAALAETVTIDLGNPVVSVDADDFIMQEVAGVSDDGVILVPVRDVAEAFHGTVVYDEAQGQIRLTFPNGNWANIVISDITAIESAANDGNSDSTGLTTMGTFINDKLYMPATIMASCLGARIELIDYGREEVFRLIYHVR